MKIQDRMIHLSELKAGDCFYFVSDIGVVTGYSCVVETHLLDTRETEYSFVLTGQLHTADTRRFVVRINLDGTN